MFNFYENVKLHLVNVSQLEEAERRARRDRFEYRSERATGWMDLRVFRRIGVANTVRGVSLALPRSQPIVLSFPVRDAYGDSISSMPSHADSLVNSRKASREPQWRVIPSRDTRDSILRSGNSTRATSTGNPDRWALDVFLYRCLARRGSRPRRLTLCSSINVATFLSPPRNRQDTFSSPFPILPFDRLPKFSNRLDSNETDCKRSVIEADQFARARGFISLGGS